MGRVSVFYKSSAPSSYDTPRHEFEWKREQCYLVRKPDPPVLVAVTKEPAGRLKTQQVQILDYNINRYLFVSMSLILTRLIKSTDSTLTIVKAWRL